MAPSRLQYFVAEDWPTKLWFAVIPTVCAAAATCATGTALSDLSGWRAWLWLVGFVVIWLFLGFFVALLVGWFVLGPLYYIAGARNGGPFKPGDRVRVLARPYRGRVSHVYSSWQGD